ncbi:hypothetical protein [Nocardioides sp. LML1-1-1.1]
MVVHDHGRSSSADAVQMGHVRGGQVDAPRGATELEVSALM